MAEIQLLEPQQLRPHVPALRALERSIEYPLGDGQAFCIDHGPRYHTFFSSMGRSVFVLAFRRGRLLGSLACVLRSCRQGTRTWQSLYLADLKLAAEARGQGLVRRMLWTLLKRLPRARLTSWRLAYCAAMQGAHGDVRRSFRGAHLGRLLEELGQLEVFFVAPETLARLDPTDAPGPLASEGLELSPRGAPRLVSTRQRKDLRLTATGTAWPLWHLPRSPAAWRGGLAHELRAAGRQLLARDPASQVCFALDRRLDSSLAWLAARGITPGAQCVIYGLRLPWAGLPTPRRLPWLHLATSEI